MRRWRKGALFVLIAAVVAFLLAEGFSPIPLRSVVWHFPVSFKAPFALVCDLDGDGNEEILMENGWRLQPTETGWLTQKVPLKEGESIFGWVTGRIRTAALVKDRSRTFWLLWWQEGWQRQKLAERVREFRHYSLDLDGDGQENDFVLLTDDKLLWFQVRPREPAVLKDSLDYPPHLREGIIPIGRSQAIYSPDFRAFLFAWRGRLQMWKLPSDWEFRWADVDEDRIADAVGLGAKITLSGATLAARLSSTDAKVKVTLPIPLAPEWRWPKDWLFCDMDGDGRKEVIAFTVRGNPIRLWVEDGRWRIQEAPFQVQGETIATIPLGGKREGVLLYSVEDGLLTLTTLFLREGQMETKSWQWRTCSVACFKSALDGHNLVIVGNWNPSLHPLWKLWLELKAWLQSMGLIASREVLLSLRSWVFKWDETKAEWQMEDAWQGEVVLVDLNGDGHKERLMLDIHPPYAAVCVLREMRLATRRKVGWKVTTLWQGQTQFWYPLLLHSQGRVWIVLCDGQTIRGWTLK